VGPYKKNNSKCGKHLARNSKKVKLVPFSKCKGLQNYHHGFKSHRRL
jgi:hypothetical protein